MSFKINRLALFTAASLCANATFAQQAVLEEIIVTARKFEESLQDTPVSVSAFTSESLKARNIGSVDEVAFFTPNLSAAQGYSGGSDGFYYIRGIGINDFTAAMDPPVGVYLDGVYLGRTAGATFDLVDIDRIEVLRGPQGTLFGRNTSGGAISITSTRPTEEFEGRAAVELGERDLAQAELMLNIPLIPDSLNARVSLLKKDQEGWVDRLFDGKTLGDVDTTAARIAIDWQASENISVLLSADYSDNDNTPQPQITSGATLPSSSPCPPFCIPLPANINDQVSPAFDKTWSAQPAINDSEVFGGSAVVDWDLKNFTIKSITAYREIDQHSTADFDVTSYAFYDDDVPLEQDQFSQEFQFSGLSANGRLNWLTGFYYYKENIDQSNAITLGATGPGGVLAVPFSISLGPGVALPLAPLVVDPPLPGDRRFRIINGQNIKPEIETWAVFGQLSFSLTEQLSLTAGARYSEDDKEQEYDFNIINSIPNHPLYPVATIPTVQLTANKKWDSWDPRIGLEYKLNESVMLYASYSEGFRSGGFNSRPVQPPVTSFDPEEVATWEAGFKSELFERRMRLNAAVFFTQYDDMQIQVLSGGFFDITNAGDAEISGVELEVTALLTDNFDVSLGLGYLDAEYKSVTPEAIAAGVTINNELPMTPELTVNLGAQYRWPLGDMGEVIARADYVYEDERYSFANNEPGNLLEDYELINLRISWISANRDWEASLIGANVTDEEYLRFAEDVRRGSSPLGTLIQFPAPPESWSVSVSYFF